MITRILLVLNGIVLFVLLDPGTAAACGISYQNGSATPTGGCPSGQPVVGAAAVAGAVAAVAVGRAVVSLVRGAASVAGSARAPMPAPPPVAQAVQSAAQGAAAANRAIAPAQQAMRAAAAAAQPGAPGAAQAAVAARQAAAAAAALVRSAYDGAEAAAQSALAVARAAETTAEGATGPAREAAKASTDAARRAAASASLAGLQAQIAHRVAEGIGTPGQAPERAAELVGATQIAANSAWAAAESADLADKAAALAEDLARGTPPNTGAGLSLTEIHDGALRAALPTLHTQFVGGHVYGDVAGHQYLAAPDLGGKGPYRDELPGASTRNPGRNPGYPDVAVHTSGWTYVYEVKVATSEYGKKPRTLWQIARYVRKLGLALGPSGQAVTYGPAFPTTVGLDPRTGILYRLWSEEKWPGVIFYAVVGRR